MLDYRGKQVKLVNKSTGIEVKKGDEVTSFRNEKTTVRSIEPPHKSSATGKINGFYTTVYNCIFVDA